MFAVPAPTPVTTPADVTVATAVLLLENVTVAPVTTLLLASSVCVVTVYVWPMLMVPGAALVMRTCVAPPTVPVALNVTGDVMPTAVAVSVFAPTVFPSFQLPTVATPLASVLIAAPVTLPPPLATANVTSTPATGLLFASVTFTDGATATLAPATAVCGSVEFFVSLDAGPAGALAVNVTGARLPVVAVTDCEPTAGPSVHVVVA